MLTITPIVFISLLICCVVVPASPIRTLSTTTSGPSLCPAHAQCASSAHHGEGPLLETVSAAATSPSSGPFPNVTQATLHGATISGMLVMLQLNFSTCTKAGQIVTVDGNLTINNGQYNPLLSAGAEARSGGAGGDGDGNVFSKVATWKMKCNASAHWDSPQTHEDGYDQTLVMLEEQQSATVFYGVEHWQDPYLAAFGKKLQLVDLRSRGTHAVWAEIGLGAMQQSGPQLNSSLELIDDVVKYFIESVTDSPMCFLAAAPTIPEQDPRSMVALCAFLKNLQTHETFWSAYLLNATAAEEGGDYFAAVSRIENQYALRFRHLTKLNLTVPSHGQPYFLTVANGLSLLNITAPLLNKLGYSQFAAEWSGSSSSSAASQVPLVESGYDLFYISFTPDVFSNGGQLQATTVFAKLGAPIFRNEHWYCGVDTVRGIQYVMLVFENNTICVVARPNSKDMFRNCAPFFPYFSAKEGAPVMPPIPVKLLLRNHTKKSDGQEFNFTITDIHVTPDPTDPTRALFSIQYEDHFSLLLEDDTCPSGANPSAPPNYLSSFSNFTLTQTVSFQLRRPTGSSYAAARFYTVAVSAVNNSISCVGTEMEGSFRSEDSSSTISTTTSSSTWNYTTQTLGQLFEIDWWGINPEHYTSSIFSVNELWASEAFPDMCNLQIKEGAVNQLKCELQDDISIMYFDVHNATSVETAGSYCGCSPGGMCAKFTDITPPASNASSSAPTQADQFGRPLLSGYRTLLLEVEYPPFPSCRIVLKYIPVVNPVDYLANEKDPKRRMSGIEQLESGVGVFAEKIHDQRPNASEESCPYDEDVDLISWARYQDMVSLGVKAASTSSSSSSSIVEKLTFRIVSAYTGTSRVPVIFSAEQCPSNPKDILPTRATLQPATYCLLQQGVFKIEVKRREESEQSASPVADPAGISFTSAANNGINLFFNGTWQYLVQNGVVLGGSLMIAALAQHLPMSCDVTFYDTLLFNATMRSLTFAEVNSQGEVLPGGIVFTEQSCESAPKLEQCSVVAEISTPRVPLRREVEPNGGGSSGNGFQSVVWWNDASSEIDPSSATSSGIINGGGGKSYVTFSDYGWSNGWKRLFANGRRNTTMPFGLLYKQLRSTDPQGAGIVDALCTSPCYTTTTDNTTCDVTRGRLLATMAMCVASHGFSPLISPTIENYCSLSPCSTHGMCDSMDAFVKQGMKVGGPAEVLVQCNSETDVALFPVLPTSTASGSDDPVVIANASILLPLYGIKARCSRCHFVLVPGATAPPHLVLVLASLRNLFFTTLLVVIVGKFYWPIRRLKIRLSIAILPNDVDKSELQKALRSATELATAARVARRYNSTTEGTAAAIRSRLGVRKSLGIMEDEDAEEKESGDDNTYALMQQLDETTAAIPSEKRERELSYGGTSSCHGEEEAVRYSQQDEGHASRRESAISTGSIKLPGDNHTATTRENSWLKDHLSLMTNFNIIGSLDATVQLKIHYYLKPNSFFLFCEIVYATFAFLYFIYVAIITHGDRGGNSNSNSVPLSRWDQYQLVYFLYGNTSTAIFAILNAAANAAHKSHNVPSCGSMCVSSFRRRPYFVLWPLLLLLPGLLTHAVPGFVFGAPVAVPALVLVIVLDLIQAKCLRALAARGSSKAIVATLILHRVIVFGIITFVVQLSLTIGVLLWSGEDGAAPMQLVGNEFQLRTVRCLVEQWEAAITQVQVLLNV